MIIILDTETTGLDTKTARIIELALVTCEATPGPIVTSAIRQGHNYHWLIDPEMPIPPTSTAIHGITNTAVAGKPNFRALIAEIGFVLRRASVIVGYNLDFDLRALKAEFERLQEPWPIAPTVPIVDVYRLWGKLEPRKLENAYTRFVARKPGDKMPNAHSAVHDAVATRNVLEGMLAAHPHLLDKPTEALSWEELALLINPDGLLRFGPSNHLRWNGLPGSGSDADLLLFTFGKHNGKAITVLAGIDPGYLRWICDGSLVSSTNKLEKAFPEHVVETCRQALALAPQAFTEWAKRKGGRS